VTRCALPVRASVTVKTGGIRVGALTGPPAAAPVPAMVRAFIPVPAAEAFHKPVLLRLARWCGRLGGWGLGRFDRGTGIRRWHGAPRFLMFGTGIVARTECTSQTGRESNDTA